MTIQQPARDVSTISKLEPRTDSWWIGLSRDELRTASQARQVAMSASKMGNSLVPKCLAE